MSNMSTSFWVCLILLTAASCYGRPNWPSGEPEPDSAEEMLEEHINLHHSFKGLVDASTKAIKDVQKYFTQKVSSVAEKHLNKISRPLSKIIAPIVLMGDRIFGRRNCSDETGDPFSEHSDIPYPLEVDSSNHGMNSQIPDDSQSFSQPTGVTTYPKDEKHKNITSYPLEVDSSSHGVNSQIPDDSQTVSQPTGVTTYPTDEKHINFTSYPLEVESTSHGVNSQIPDESQSFSQPTGVTTYPKDEKHKNFTSYPLEVENTSHGVNSQIPEDSHSFSQPTGVTTNPKEDEQTDFPVVPNEEPENSDYNVNSDVGLVFTEPSENGKELFSAVSDVDIRFGEGKGPLNS